MGGPSGSGNHRTRAPRRGRWSQSDIARLKELYGLRDDAAIARELNRPVSSVKKMAAQVFRGGRKTGPWSAKEVLELKRYLGATTPEVIGKILGRRPEEVSDRIIELGRIQKSGRWSREEVTQFKRIYGRRTDEDLSCIFGRSVDSIRRMASNLALAKDKAFLRQLDTESHTRMPRWTDEELDLLQNLYPKTRNIDIAKELGRTVKSVVSKAHTLGLKKDPQRLREMGRENVSLRYK